MTTTATLPRPAVADEEAATVERLCARIRLLEDALGNLVAETCQRQGILSGPAPALSAAIDVLHQGRARSGGVRTATRYRLAFERIGSTQVVEPLEIEANTPDWLAQTIHLAALRHLPSRTFEVVLDLRRGRGYLLAGGSRNVGSFTVEVFG